MVCAITGQSDAELLSRARDGDEAAFTELYVRHRAVAKRVAATYRRADAEDLVNEAFEKVLGALRRGGGPTDAFRAYLLVTLRRLAVERNGQYGMAEEPLDEVPEPVIAVVDGPDLSAADRHMITQAFETLPDRWQAVLWYTAVEGRHPREIASRLGLSANAVSALAYRAREQLRQAYLQAHLNTNGPSARCKTHRSWLGAYVRGSLSRRDDATTRRHLERCTACKQLADELTDVNRLLVRSIVPLFLIPSGGKLASLASAVETAAAAGEATAPGRRAAWSWLKATAPAAGGIAAAAGAILGLGSASTLVWREDKPDTVQATRALRNTTTTLPPPAAGAAPATSPCEAGATDETAASTAATEAETTATTMEPVVVEVPLLGASVQLPAVLDDSLAPAAIDATAETTEAACTTTSSTSGEVASSSTAETTTATTVTPSTDDALVVEAAPLALTLVVDLPEGISLDLGTILPTDCEIAVQGGQITCDLTVPVTDTQVTADLGLELEEILQGELATVTVTQGDQTVEVATDDIVTTLTDTVDGLLFPPTTTTTTTAPR